MLQTTPGLAALQFAAILDNSLNSRFVDVQSSYTFNYGFNDFFDIWDDENCLIDHFSNNGTGTTNLPNWVRSVVFSTAGLFTTAPVITFENSNITNTDAGITVTDSNGVYAVNDIVEGQTLWQLSVSNVTGNFQGASLFNTYAESSAGANSNTPWAGTGIAGLVAGPSTGAAHFTINGDNVVGGQLPSGGSGTTSLVYFVVANDTTTGMHTAPLPAYSWQTTGSDHPAIKFPRIANSTDNITYDILRMGTNALAYGSAYPSVDKCTGGSPTACGSVVLGLGQCSGLVCSYTDNNVSLNTTSYPMPQNNFSPAALIFWPGSVVTANTTVHSTTDVVPLVAFGMFNNPVLVAEQCSAFGAPVTGGYVACLSSTSTNNNSLNGQAALLLGEGNQTGGSFSSITKGRLNFPTSPFSSLQPHHIVTLIDSQPSLTAATFGYRAIASEKDVWIGTDVPAGGVALDQGQLALGSPTMISNYINSVGDNSAFLERLTSSLKMFKVPIQTPGATVALSTTSLSANTCRTQTATLNGLLTTSVVKWSWASTPIGVLGYGTGSLQVSTFATTNTANVVVCNITSSAITPGSMSLNLRAEL